MSVLVMMGFDELALLPNDTIPANFIQADGWTGGTYACYRAPGRFGLGHALGVSGSIGNTVYLPLRNRVNNGGGTMEFAYKITAGASVTWRISMWDSVTNTFPVGWDILALARVGILVGGVTRHITTPGSIVEGQWHWMQVKWTSGNPGSDTAEFKIDGNVIASYTGLTVPANMDVFHVWLFANGGGSVPIFLDDIVIQDLTGPAPNNDFLGNVRVGAQWADAPGDLTEYSVVGAASNWEASKNIVVNSGVYVETDTVGDSDLYNLIANVPARDIYGIQVKGVFLQNDATQLYGSLVIKTGGTEYVGTSKGLASGYRSQWWNWDKNPNTGLAWTNSDLASLQIGPHLESSD